MERLDRFDVSTATHGRAKSQRRRARAFRQNAQTVKSVTLGAKTQVESGARGKVLDASGGQGGEDGTGSGGVAAPRPNPIVRYIACFATANAAAEAAGVSAAMLRRMRVRGYVSTRDRALRMARACRFKVKPAELMALTQGRG